MSVATFSPTVLGPIAAPAAPRGSTLAPLPATRGTIFYFSPGRQMTLPGVVIPAQVLLSQNLRVGGLESRPVPGAARFILGGQEFNGVPIQTADGWIIYNFFSSLD